MLNSLYHGVLNENYDSKNINSSQTGKLKSILKLGFLIKPSSDRIRECDFYRKSSGSWNSNNEICLSLHPHRNFKERIILKEKYTTCYSSYELTTSSFAFVINKSLLSDDNISIESGELEDEIYIDGDISLNKYLDGIFNTGVDIKKEVLLYNYYLLYKMNKIGKETFLEIMKIVDPMCISSEERFLSKNKYGVPLFEQIHNSLLNDELKRFIVNINSYNLILDAVIENGTQLSVLDFEGNIIYNIEEQFEKLEKIKRLSIEFYSNKTF